MATRREKYPDTKTFKFYNANPKGKFTCDCVARAVCTALDEPYEKVLKEMFEMSIKTGYEYTDGECMDKYLQSKGWTKMKQPRKHNNTKYTGEEFKTSTVVLEGTSIYITGTLKKGYNNLNKL
mgnify:CR=1 FL=1